MGLLNLPHPLFDWIDQAVLGFLPPLLRLLLWAVLAAVLAMEFYRLLSPQKRISAIKLEFRAAQQRLNAFDGAFEEAWPLIGRVLGLAFKRIGLVLPATLAASLPLLAVIVWLDASYGHRYPAAAEPVEVSVPRDGYEGRLDQAVAPPPSAVILDPAGAEVTRVVLEAPVPLLHKRRHWNLLLGNPAGYLPDDAPVERITLNLPRLEVLSFGPQWLRGWEPAFFTALMLFAFLLKYVRRIE